MSNNAKALMPTVDIVLAGKTYKAKLGMKAMIALDKEFGINLFEGFDGIVSPVMLSRILWACLQRYHPDLGIEDVEDLLDDADQEEIQESLGKAFNNALTDEVKKNIEDPGVVEAA